MVPRETEGVSAREARAVRAKPPSSEVSKDGDVDSRAVRLAAALDPLCKKELSYLDEKRDAIATPTPAGAALRDAAAALARELADRSDAGPAILTGDFNAPIDAPELAAVRAGFDDAFAAVGIPPGDERRLSCGPWPIDHVRVRGLAVASCRVARGAADASDHWPVVADLEPA